MFGSCYDSQFFLLTQPKSALTGLSESQQFYISLTRIALPAQK